MSLRREPAPLHPVTPILEALSPFGIDRTHLVKPPSKGRRIGRRRMRVNLRMVTENPDLAGVEPDHRIVFFLGDQNDTNTAVWTGQLPDSFSSRLLHRLARVNQYFSGKEAYHDTVESLKQRLSNALRNIHPDLKVALGTGERTGPGFVPVHRVVVYSTTREGQELVQQFHAGMQDVRGVESYEKRASRPRGWRKLLRDLFYSPFRD